MPQNYIIPNFANKTVGQAKTAVAANHVGLRIKTPTNTEWHEPLETELSLVISNNGPTSQPGTTTPSGEWVGVEVAPV